jgi:ABC-type glutathione transport system ATPase component
MRSRLVNAVLAVPPKLGRVRLLAIDGPSGVGKSVLTSAVVVELRARGFSAVRVSTDDFATWEDPVSWWPRLVDVRRPLRPVPQAGLDHWYAPPRRASYGRRTRSAGAVARPYVPGFPMSAGWMAPMPRPGSNARSPATARPPGIR